jgi:hypothetical protein
MTLKIMEEITEWDVAYRQPNHVYLMSGDKVLAYVPWKKGKPVYFRNFQRMDRRGRKFVEVKKNPWRFDLSTKLESGEEATQPQGQIWEVEGSKGARYTVSMSAGRWSCSCPGHGFRNRCRHVDELRASNPQLG